MVIDHMIDEELEAVNTEIYDFFFDAMATNNSRLIFSSPSVFEYLVVIRYTVLILKLYYLLGYIYIYIS